MTMIETSISSAAQRSHHFIDNVDSTLLVQQQPFFINLDSLNLALPMNHCHNESRYSGIHSRLCALYLSSKGHHLNILSALSISRLMLLYTLLFALDCPQSKFGPALSRVFSGVLESAWSSGGLPVARCPGGAWRGLPVFGVPAARGAVFR